MKDKIVKHLTESSPIVEFNLRAAKRHDFFSQYQAIHEKHKAAMDKIIKEMPESAKEHFNKIMEGEE